MRKMKLKIGDIYQIQVGEYPWSDDYVKQNRMIGIRLLREDEAKQMLEGQHIRLTSLTPTYLPKGDRDLTCEWILGTMLSGPKRGMSTGTVASWLGPIKCNCSTQQLTANGCNCGGI